MLVKEKCPLLIWRATNQKNDSLGKMLILHVTDRYMFYSISWLPLGKLADQATYFACINFYLTQAKLKLIDRLHATCWMPPDFWQSDNSNGLVMVIRNYHWLKSASRVLISTCSAPLFKRSECKQFSVLNLNFDLLPWPIIPV